MNKTKLIESWKNWKRKGRKKKALEQLKRAQKEFLCEQEKTQRKDLEEQERGIRRPWIDVRDSMLESRGT